MAVRLVQEGIYIYSHSAPSTTDSSSWVDLRLDSADFQQAIAMNPTAKYAFDFIASDQSGQQVRLEVDIVSANNMILLPANFWSENFTACEAECGGSVGKQSMRNPQCLDGFTGDVLAETSCFPPLDVVKSRACTVAACDEVRCVGVSLRFFFFITIDC